MTYLGGYAGNWPPRSTKQNLRELRPFETFGIRFSKVFDAAIASLKSQGCDRLIIDLRGCIGGSLGFARLVSYMCLLGLLTAAAK
jgi:hypothetical protein